jgi:hypothetical protein
MKESLIIRHTLQVHIKEGNNDQQRENILHKRCYVQNKVCSLIIVNESCANIPNSNLFSKLNLNTIKHARPYRLQLLNDSGEVKVTKQVLVSFFIEKYTDEVLCNVVAMILAIV